jgi:HD-GYP domain-containing protein (c-di-GMP phosphodiesterase class II)
MAFNEVNPADLIPIPGAMLKLGLVLTFNLYDSDGSLLLAKGQRIETSHQLGRITGLRGLLADSITSSTNAVLSGFDAASRGGIPLKELDKLTRSSALASLQVRTEATPVSLPQAWTDIESALRTALGNLPLCGDTAREAATRVETVAVRLQKLFADDREAALFLLFNRAVTDFNGYSSQHSLLCAALALDVCSRLPVSDIETHSIIRAALTMNVSIKQLQDRMAGQKTKPTQEQLLAIDAHAGESRRLLDHAGVTDHIWLAVVGQHHDELPHCPAINDRPTVEKLTKILQVIDRYSATMSPRGSRPGRESLQAVKAVIRSRGSVEHDEVGLDLMQNLGLFPPGTYVQLKRGDAAIVLRRGTKLNEPVVATVLNKRGEPVLAPRMVSTESPEFAVQSGLSGSSIKVRLNEVEMLRHLSSSRLDLAVG